MYIYTCKNVYIYIYMSQSLYGCINNDLQCNVPTGPNPNKERKVCYAELGVDESEKDCLAIHGDPKVRYPPPY